MYFDLSVVIVYFGKCYKFVINAGIQMQVNLEVTLCATKYKSSI